ncbi:hypothetical protein DAPPUDRAFT_104470 [Daphnia pulex]|uniref:Uncharacterized protein n=1 Tax=Daphnia pulex TaxID=6669 RepID=E9GMB7_DAPPU|nr:hypothetical protein DAPPUDRAFT_104470 [Daphnia pulex]|eukprot:EFX79338.1 hypothetical protein DAPPUDRAFT_104470 [Daphnia pulex]
MPPKRGESTVPFQIRTRSNTQTAVTPVTRARVVTPTTLVPSPSVRGGSSRLTFNLPVPATAVARVADMALPQNLIDALTNLATAMAADRTAAQNQSTALLNALDQQRIQSVALVQQLADDAAAAPAAATPRVAAAAVESIPCFEGCVELWTFISRNHCKFLTHKFVTHKKRQIFDSDLTEEFICSRWFEVVQTLVKRNLGYAAPSKLVEDN